MKKVQNLPNKNLQSNNSTGKPLRESYNNYRSQSRYRNIFPEDPRTEEIHNYFSKDRSRVSSYNLVPTLSPMKYQAFGHPQPRSPTLSRPNLYIPRNTKKYKIPPCKRRNITTTRMQVRSND